MLSDPSPTIVNLASQIQKNTALINDYFSANSLPTPSFATDAFPFFPGTGPAGIDPFPPPPPAITSARSALRQACDTLQQLMTTPTDHLQYFACQHHASACLQYAYHFELASHVPNTGSTTFAAIATAAGVDQSICTRVLRMLMTLNYFSEPAPGHVAHTVGSHLLTLPSARAVVGYLISEGFYAASSFARHTERFGYSPERNETPWNTGHGIDKPIFEFFETDPARMQRFMGTMAALGGGEAYNIKHLVTGYDWKALGEGTVVDVGGSVGHACFAIAAVAPELKFVVQDLEKVAEGARARAEAEGQKDLDRVEFMTHSFLTPQPVKGAKVYFLRFICHDYSDKYASEILRQIVPAMGPESRILVIDGVMPEPGTLAKIDERLVRFMDMEMMMVYNASERDMGGWKALFAKTDERLHLKSIAKPPGSAQSVMELVLRD